MRWLHCWCAVLTAAFCLLVIECGALPAQERYLQANKAYEQGEFEKALQLYETIERKGATTLANSGNASYELGRMPQAVLYWRRTQHFVKPRDFYLLQDRIETIQREQGGALQQTRLKKSMQALEVAMRVMPHKAWQLLFFMVLALGLLCVRWIGRRRWLPLVGWVLLFCILSILLMVRAQVRARRTGIVMRNTPVYVTTDTHARVKKQLTAGQEVVVPALKDGWVQLADGSVVGWVPIHTIQIV